MKKNILLKSILLLIVVSLLIIGFTGCGVVIPPVCTTGTLYLSIGNDNWTYYVYMDGNDWTGTYLGTTDGWGDITLYNVPVGYHTFYVVSTDYFFDGSAGKTITCPGANYLTINTY